METANKHLYLSVTNEPDDDRVISAPKEVEKEHAAKLNAETAEMVTDEGREYREMAEPIEKITPLESDLKTMAEQVDAGTEKIRQERRDAALEKILKME
jgi:hypothetical protein